MSAKTRSAQRLLSTDPSSCSESAWVCSADRDDSATNMTEHAIVEVLIELANAKTPYDAMRATERAQLLMEGVHESKFASLLSTLQARVGEVHQLRRLSGIDDLTGIPNRRVWNGALDREFARFQRRGGNLTVLLLELDDLKAINNEFGHAIGDQAILALARACEGSVRGTDLVARLSGKEFAVLLPDTDEAAAQIVATRIRERIESVTVGKATLRASIGLASTSAGRNTMQSLMMDADSARKRDRDERKCAHEKRCADVQAA